MKKMKLIYIEWEDAVANASWYTEEELRQWHQQGGVIIKEVGWLFSEEGSHITMIGRISPGEGNIYSTYGALQKIPKTWIRKRIDLTKYIPVEKI